MALIGFGLCCVWLEIGRMVRAANVVFHPQASWMTREALVAVPLFAAGLFAAWFGAANALLLAAGLGVIFLYCQARILRAAKGIPAWREATVVPLAMVTGLTEGAGLLVAVGWVLVPVGSLGLLAAAGLVLVVLRHLAWRRHRERLVVIGMPTGTLGAFNTFDPFILFGGHLAPAVLLALGWWLPASAGQFAVVPGALLALFGGWLIKYVLIAKAAFNQGFQLPHEPVRGQGRPGPAPRPSQAGRIRGGYHDEYRHLDHEQSAAISFLVEDKLAKEIENRCETPRGRGRRRHESHGDV